MDARQFRITGIEPCRRDSAVSNGVVEARDSALALIAERLNAKGTSCAVKDGVLICKSDLTGRHSLVSIGVVVWVTDTTPVASTC